MGFVQINSAALSELYQKYYKSFFTSLLKLEDSDLDEETIAREGAEWFSYFLLNADPTFVIGKNVMGTYSKWCLGLLMKQDFSEVTSAGGLVVLINGLADELHEALTEYMGIQKLLKGPYEKYKSITVFKTVWDLRDFLEEFRSQDMQEIARGSSEVVYEDSSWLVVSPKSYYAAMYYGKQTEWCTSDPRSSNHFNSYTKNGQVLVMFLSLSGKHGSVQYSWPSRELRDESDKSVDPESFFMDVLPEAAADAVCAYLRAPLNMLYSSRRRLFQARSFEDTLPSDQGEELLITASRYRGIEDTLVTYNDHRMHWLNPRLEALSGDSARLVSTLQGDDALKEACLDSFGRFLSKYFEILRGSSRDYFDKLGLHYKAKSSIEAVVQGIKDAMDFNGFVPVGYHMGRSSVVTAPDKTQVGTPGSFYFHAVYPADLSWATNFQARVSLHLSRVQVRMREDAGFESADYELGDFYEVRLDKDYGTKIVTDLGIDVDSFKSWLSIKKDAYLKRRFGKVSSQDRVDQVALEYKKLLTRMASDQLRESRAQLELLSYLSLGLRAGECLRAKEGGPAPTVGASGSFRAGPAVLAAPAGFTVEDYLKAQDEGRPEAVQALLSPLRDLGVKMDMWADMFSSYEAQARESLEHIDFLAEDYSLDGVSVAEAVDAFMDMFMFANKLLPHLSSLASGMNYALESASYGSPKILYQLLPASTYWSKNITSPIDDGLTAADLMAARWGRFMTASQDLVKKFIKSLR